MRTRFQNSLLELRERLLEMAGLVEQACQRAIQAYSTNDASLCDLVVRSERSINRMERTIDQHAMDVLAQEQPMATDLRFLIAVTRINADLERIGDQAASIANRVRDQLHLLPADLPVDIPKIADLAAGMVRMALQSFIDGNAATAHSVLLLDDQVDELNREAHRQLERFIMNNPSQTEQALNALVISRNLERVGDHATNIAEDVIFWVMGSDVRHSGRFDPSNV